MLTATSPSGTACSRAIRINCKCALCKAPIVGTSTRGLFFANDLALATVVRISTPPALPNRLQSANGEMYLGRQDPNQRKRINRPVAISASIQNKSMLNQAWRNIPTPSFS